MTDQLPPSQTRLRKRISRTGAPSASSPIRKKYTLNAFQRFLRRMRHLLEYLLLRIAIGTLRLVGVDRASRWSGKLWRSIAPRTRRHTRALKHLAMAFPEKTDAERDAIAHAMWENLGRTAVEACMLDTIIRDPARITIDTPEVIEAVKAAGGRVVIASMHFGNWELGMWPFTRAGFQSVALYQKVQNPYIDALVHRLRAPMLPGGLFGKSHNTPRQLLKAVRDGQPLGILADLRDHRGVEVMFFNHAAPSTPFPAMIARHSDALLIAGRVTRVEGVCFKMDGRIITVPQTGDKNADILAATQNLQSAFECWIRENPEQWMWAHQRWGKGH